MKDLFVLAADKSMEFALKGALDRPLALGIRPIEFVTSVHTNRDGGSRTTGPQILALQRRQFSHALLVLDFEGSGTNKPDARSLEAELDKILSPQWRDDAKAIVIEPEMDTWIWGADAVVEAAIAWTRPSRVRDWLSDEGFVFNDAGKPARPKEAFERVLRESGMPKSAAIYRAIASQTSLARCRDGAFIRMREQLKTWFPN